MQPIDKSKQPWKSGVVVNRQTGRTYDVQTQDGRVYRRNRVFLRSVPHPTLIPPSPSPAASKPYPTTPPTRSHAMLMNDVHSGGHHTGGQLQGTPSQQEHADQEPGASSSAASWTQAPGAIPAATGPRSPQAPRHHTTGLPTGLRPVGPATITRSGRSVKPKLILDL